MPRTPQRQYGPHHEDDSVQFEDRGSDPSVVGSVWRNGGSIKGLDSVATYDLRGVTLKDGGTPAAGGPHHVLNVIGASVVDQGAGAADLDITAAGGGGTKLIQFSWADSNGSPTLQVTQQAPTWRKEGAFIFRGTSVHGSPTAIKVIAWALSQSDGVDLRVTDETNGGNLIAQKDGISNTSPAVIDMGALSNLPSGEAVFELQGRVTGAKGFVNALSIGF